MAGAAQELGRPAQQVTAAKQTVWGQNIITCRDFNIDGQKAFEFLGGFKTIEAAPVLGDDQSSQLASVLALFIRAVGLPEVAFVGRSNVGKSSLLNW